MTNSIALLEAVIEHVPGWAYLFLLIISLGISFLLARFGLRVVGAFFERMRRPSSTPRPGAI